AWRLSNSQLQPVWSNHNAGTSPVIADTLLFVYDPGGGLRVYRSDTGVQLADLACGAGHWNSPIVIDGKIALPEGNSNSHATSGVLDIWRLPCERATKAIRGMTTKLATIQKCAWWFA